MPVADAELRHALEGVLKRHVRDVHRTAHPYESSHAIEDVEVVFDEGSPLRLVFKEMTALSLHASGSRRATLHDPDREIEAYVHGLAFAGLDVPACYGAVCEPGRRWLFLESVDGVPLWQVAGSAAWMQAAGWLAALHARGAPAHRGHLMRYDAAYLQGWLAQALARTPEGALDGVAAVWERAVRRLAMWPDAVIHGDFYPSNVLVQAGPAGSQRIRPVDWELAGIGPALLDLAALTSGGWTEGERGAIALAYHAALPPPARPAVGALLDTLACARLVVAVQWLGWPRHRPAPPEHEHDWLADATALTSRIAT
ncbi:MAG: hypothetical protein QOG15_651 [Solirubrobacteraceae bacterium]|jgi:aminoglycoside phosphotransferase (APT) family kinase protein|nr:hypothetical protein [Solirubrobacteraceae bacterium]